MRFRTPRRTESRAHHPVFARFTAGSGPIPNWIGVTTRREFFSDDLPFVVLSHPPNDDQYLEWIDVLEAVVAARERFTMLELGAGYGRWIVNAAAAVRSFSALPCRLIGVEAEPTHFQWMAQHCKDNGVEPTLVCAAVAGAPGVVEFAVGNARGWYGQAIADGTWSPEETVEVEAVTLSSLLAPLDDVDLIHIDIQGAEADVAEEAAHELARVRRVHIGTHGRMQEEALRRLFVALGWVCVNDYASETEADTPWGTFTFQDGVQTWINPKL